MVHVGYLFSTEPGHCKRLTAVWWWGWRSRSWGAQAALQVPPEGGHTRPHHPINCSPHRGTQKGCPLVFLISGNLGAFLVYGSSHPCLFNSFPTWGWNQEAKSFFLWWAPSKSFNHSSSSSPTQMCSSHCLWKDSLFPGWLCTLYPRDLSVMLFAFVYFISGRQ